jgi:hypothetical protein
MKKSIVKLKVLVQGERPIEKLHFVQLAQVRRHSRVLYIPLDAMAVHWSRIKKGDIIKYTLNEIRRAPDEDEPIRDAGELET